MRIIGGDLKGRYIQPPSNFRGRPTTDVAKEGLFNILANRFDFSELSVLDLFSGSGNISFEFASRGCVNITSVEKDFFHFRFISKTISDLKLTIKAVHSDAFRFLEKTEQQFDLIFADPPFDFSGIGSLYPLIFNRSLLKDHGLFILEHAREHDFSAMPYFSELRKYGHVQFSFFKQSAG